MRRDFALLAVLALPLITGCRASDTSGEAPTVGAEAFTQMTIDEVLWSDDARLQEPLRSTWAERDLVLFAHVAEWSGFHALKRFTLDADKWFYLEAPGHPTVEAMALTGGVTTKDGGIRYVTLRILSDEEMDRSVEYTLRPRNKTSELAWSVQASVMPPAM